MSCSTLNSLQSEGVYHGGYSCIASGSSGSSLSPGAKGGIAVGVILGVLFILLIPWYVLRARRHRKSQNMPKAAPHSPSIIVYNEKQTAPPNQPSLKTLLPRKPVGSTAAQLHGSSIYEVPMVSTPVREYHELDADPVLSSHQRPINSDV
jgi:hypothetical protein